MTLLPLLEVNYAHAAVTSQEDLFTERISYPGINGDMQAYVARPKEEKKYAAVVVIHENRGLNPYIEDVVRRVALAGFVAFGPDALYPVGGYPGNDDEGRALQAKLDRNKMTEDFVAAVKFLHAHPACNGSLGVTGFCFDQLFNLVQKKVTHL